MSRSGGPYSLLFFVGSRSKATGMPMSAYHVSTWLALAVDSCVGQRYGTTAKFVKVI